METKIKNTFLSTVSPKYIKYFGIILTKHVQDLYPENYKML